MFYVVKVHVVACKLLRCLVNVDLAVVVVRCLQKEDSSLSCVPNADDLAAREVADDALEDIASSDSNVNRRLNEGVVLVGHV